MDRGVGRALGALAALLILAADVSPAGRYLLRLPATVTVAVGQDQAIRLGAPGGLGVRAAGSGLELDGAPATSWRRVPGAALRLLPRKPGTYRLQLRLFGVLPWPGVRVQAVAVPALQPGGQAVGVLLRGRGPLVVGTSPVPGPAGPVGSPAAAAGIRPGDTLLSVAGRRAATAATLAAALAGLPRGAAVPLEVLRQGRVLHLAVRPVRAGPGSPPRIGAWVRDSTAGIGTLTFTAPGGIFAAIGHPVVDPTTGTAVVLGSGTLLPSRIAGLERSRDGRPGEKIGVLAGGVPALGSVQTNGDYGVFGRLVRAPAPGPLTTALPVALPDQVRRGPAEVLTVLAGSRVGTYSARITSVLAGRGPSTRGFVLQVTDPRLLAASGGIVQGMSGSPVVQDGRLVGALTHVFVDDPARGYGVLAYWMAHAAGVGGPTAV